MRAIPTKQELGTAAQRSEVLLDGDSGVCHICSSSSGSTLCGGASKSFSNAT